MGYSTSSRQQGPARRPSGERKFPDSIFTDDQGWVRLSEIDGDKTITVRGYKIQGHQISLSIYTLACGHTGKGIEVSKMDVIFCEECKTKEFVHSVR